MSECVIHVCVLVVGVHMLDVSNLSLFHKDVFYSMMTVMDLAIPEFMALSDKLPVDIVHMTFTSCAVPIVEILSAFTLIWL